MIVIDKYDLNKIPKFSDDQLKNFHNLLRDAGVNSFQIPMQTPKVPDIRSPLPGMAKDIKEINEKLTNVGTTLDIIANSIGANAQINQREMLEIKGLLIDMQKIMIDDNEDSESKEAKITLVLKKALEYGGQAALALFVEYIKYEAKAHGFPIV